MKWTLERLKYLAETNKEKKIQRYFSIKKLIEDIVEEETHCQKFVEKGKAICGVKLDCHLHDWRQKND